MRSSYSSHKSLTDDLPICKNTGIGYSINQIYREDGNPQEEHMYEDCSCHLKYSEDLYLYAVFDGKNSKKATNFCSQQMSAELLFWKAVNYHPSDEEVKELIRQIFITTEENYMQSLNDILAEKANLLCDLPQNINVYGNYHNNPRILDRIEQIDYELASETSAALAIIYNSKLYVANAGNCRVLLCQTDQDPVLTVKQLSTDHNLSNEDELLRLQQIGVDINNLKHNAKRSNLINTRCLGNYTLKEDYKNYPQFHGAQQCPVISEPDIIGGIPLDDSYRFLLIMSSGLHKSVEEATRTDQVNKYIAECTVEQFREQGTLASVAQGVVDKIVRLHRDFYMSNSVKNASSPCKREDITLVIRNFNYPMPNAVKSPTTHSSSSVESNAGNSVESNNFQSTITSTQYTESVRSQSRTNTVDNSIEAYVDFTEFNKNFEKARASGRVPPSMNNTH